MLLMKGESDKVSRAETCYKLSKWVMNTQLPLLSSVYSSDFIESERLLLLAALAAHGLRVFEDEGKFNCWLRCPLAILDGHSPMQLLDTTTGFQVVDQILGRIEYGVYS